MGMTSEEMRDLIQNSEHLFDWEAIAMVPKLAATVQKLLAEIRDSEAREADVRNRAEVAEAKLASLNDENINPEVYRVEDGHTFEVSPWPSMEGKCHLCGHPETLHMEVRP